MPSAKAPASNSVLRNLPSVDELLRSSVARDIMTDAGEMHAAALIREVIDDIRQEIGMDNDGRHSKETLLATAERMLQRVWQTEQMTGIHRVINATGVIIHTNLGRAPLSENARKAIAEKASGYCTLEYDIETGKRGKRGLRAENLLAELTGAESVLIVNNCAAAAFFVLTVFASGGEVVISRGELVEIGGDFRVPDVLAHSGAALREVGTTNRTNLSDYEKAINENTRVILRVHPSNYKIVGFTSTPSVAELAGLAQKHNLLFYEDLGSGALIDLTRLGLSDEPLVSGSITAGVDIVTFSGDKLLGGPQAGVIAGKAEFIGRLRKHPLYRALRVDKLAYAALEATLDSYRRDAAYEEIPVLRMMAISKDEVAARVNQFAEQLSEKQSETGNLQFEITDGESAVGGGAAPMVRLETKLLAMTHKKITVSRFEQLLRRSSPPVVARIVDDRVLIDLRTVSETDEMELLEILCRISRSSAQNPA
ncbi:MAG: L-seryl-tRNA(Sec) selenium transferase [Pyrinomonadaceae bacterium]